MTSHCSPLIERFRFPSALFVGLCGGSASGKTTVANKIIEALDVPWVVLLSMDSFYKVGGFGTAFWLSPLELRPAQLIPNC